MEGLNDTLAWVWDAGRYIGAGGIGVWLAVELRWLRQAVNNGYERNDKDHKQLQLDHTSLAEDHRELRGLPR